MHIGLIGGIGPAATVVYYQRLVAAMEGAPIELTIVQAHAPTLVVNNRADDRTAQAQVYAELIDRLKAAGADCAAITSLGGHFCFDETVALSSLPLVSAVTPLDAFFAEKGYKTVGLLGTEVVMRTSLYGMLEQTAAVAPEERQAVGDAYLKMALSGECDAEMADYFVAEGQKLMDSGADAVVLAGTDLGLAFTGRDTGYPVIDALDVHVALLAKLAGDRLSLAEVAA